MYFTGIPIGLLSVGAIDFGIIVDGAVIMAENIAHRLGGAGRARTQQNVNKIVLAAALEVERPVFFSVLMIIGAYLPLLSLASIEGLLFRPMALTLVFALVGALFFALFVVPVLATFLFRHGYREWENPLLRWFRPVYAAMPAPAARRPRWLVAGGGGPVAGGGLCPCAAAIGHGVPALHGRRRDLGPRQFSRGDFDRADRALRQASPRDHAGVPRDQVRHDPVGPQRQRHRPLPAQPHGNDGRPEAARARGSDSTTKHELVAAMGKRLRERISHHAIQLHAADHRQRDGGHQRHFGQPGRRVLRPRLGRAPAAGPADRASCSARCPVRWT